MSRGNIGQNDFMPATSMKVNMRSSMAVGNATPIKRAQSKAGLIVDE